MVGSVSRASAAAAGGASPGFAAAVGDGSAFVL
jgi:hypothetical protein